MALSGRAVRVRLHAPVVVGAVGQAARRAAADEEVGTRRDGPAHAKPEPVAYLAGEGRSGARRVPAFDAEPVQGARAVAVAASVFLARVLSVRRAVVVGIGARSDVLANAVVAIPLFGIAAGHARGVAELIAAVAVDAVAIGALGVTGAGRPVGLVRGAM